MPWCKKKIIITNRKPKPLLNTCTPKGKKELFYWRGSPPAVTFYILSTAPKGSTSTSIYVPPKSPLRTHRRNSWQRNPHMWPEEGTLPKFQKSLQGFSLNFQNIFLMFPSQKFCIRGSEKCISQNLPQTWCQLFNLKQSAAW